MKADALTPRDLFEGKVQYEIPAFQRPYVWNEEDQWAPLWLDVQRVAEGLVSADESANPPDGSAAHFLGAVVLKELTAHAGDVTRHSVIDGQQRMTTLQILLDASHSAVVALGHELEAEALEELILNSGNRFAGSSKRFKLWPSRSDREAFEAAMDDKSEALPDHRITEAHTFFSDEIRDWILDADGENEANDADQAARARALSSALQLHLRVVAINLGGDDDDQLIFETLNDRGTPLLAADLIKNWMFLRGDELGADTEHWSEFEWAELDDDWWREEISQGRYMRSRIDIFLQYWLTMRMKDEIASDGVFRRFREHADACMADADSANEFLEELRRDAGTFRSFAQMDPDTPAGRFYSRVVESFELAATTPLLLWMLSDNHRVPDTQVEIGLSALESWVIRRILLRMTMKDVNKLMVAALSMLEQQSVDEAGSAIREFLGEQTADARLWPPDEDLVAALPEIRMYGNIKQSRIRVILEAVEKNLRSERHEDVSLPPDLQVEHIMPRAWETNWSPDPPLSAEEALERTRRIDTLGNLTLVTQKLNGSLSHRPWTDEEAKLSNPTGPRAGKGKRSLIDEGSLLAINRAVTDQHEDAWTDADIIARGGEMTTRICEIWPAY